MLEQASSLNNQSEEDETEQKKEEEIVTQKDVKEYAEKLKEEFLNSDHRVKIASLPTPGQSSSGKKMNLTGTSFTSIINKHKPIPMVGGASFKPATIGFGGIKNKLKLNSQMSSDS